MIEETLVAKPEDLGIDAHARNLNEAHEERRDSALCGAKVNSQ